VSGWVGVLQCLWERVCESVVEWKIFLKINSKITMFIITGIMCTRLQVFVF